MLFLNRPYFFVEPCLSFGRRVVTRAVHSIKSEGERWERHLAVTWTKSYHPEGDASLKIERRNPDRHNYQDFKRSVVPNFPKEVLYKI